MVKKFYSKLLVVVSIPVLLNGCGAGKVIVHEPFREHYKANTVNITRNTATTTVPVEYQTHFEKTLKNKLEQDHNFGTGNDLTIRYRFLQCDEGSQFGRWFLGGFGNVGEGSLTIEAKFYNKLGTEIGKVNAEGKIGSGIVGGSFNDAVETAAESLAEYVAKNFK
jgi:hypothetical protein